MRLLWILPKAAPALLRHLVAYVELAGLELAKAQREISSEFLATAIVAICGLFAVFMGCLAVVAYTWDTPYRMTAIACMAGVFLAAAIAAAIYRYTVVRARSEILAAVRREWHEDRGVFENILSSNQD